MNRDESRLQEIQVFKASYRDLLNDEDNTQLQIDCINMQLNKLEEEEKEILERCDVI